MPVNFRGAMRRCRFEDTMTSKEVDLMLSPHASRCTEPDLRASRCFESSMPWHVPTCLIGCVTATDRMPRWKRRKIEAWAHPRG